MKADPMKVFTIYKNGYRSGVYGCISEYFTITVQFKNGIVKNYYLKGLYGINDNIYNLLKSLGFKCLRYGTGIYGKIDRKDDKFFDYENNIADQIKKDYEDMEDNR